MDSIGSLGEIATSLLEKVKNVAVSEADGFCVPHLGSHRAERILPWSSWHLHSEGMTGHWIFFVRTWLLSHVDGSSHQREGWEGA